MPVKVQFNRKVHNKIQIDKRKKNVERMQDKQQDTNKQKH
jgi:hypothetical protein